MKPFALFALACLSGLGLELLAAPQDVVLPRERRTELLTGVQTILELKHKERQFFAEATSPFGRIVEGPSLVEAGSGHSGDAVATPVVATPPPRLSDERALAAVAAKFKPEGSLVGATTAFLNLPGGNRMELGDSFQATIRGHSYRITIQDVTADSYTLRCGTATVERDIHEPKGLDSTISRQPSPPAPDTSKAAAQL